MRVHAHELNARASVTTHFGDDFRHAIEGLTIVVSHVLRCVARESTYSGVTILRAVLG